MDVVTDEPTDAPASEDAELAELAALAADGDPDAPIPDDAVPFHTVVGADDDAAPLLPEWYMPAPMAGAPLLRGWRRTIAWIIVLAFVAVVASGLCSTYGEVTT